MTEVILGSLQADTQLIEDRIDELINVMVKRFKDAHPKQDIGFEVEMGKKYYKMIEVTHPGSERAGRSVHAFISRQTGAVYKPASYRGPAKIARYNLLDDISYQQCLDRADWCGAYLYLRWHHI